jgi:hypothetical protein
VLSGRASELVKGSLEALVGSGLVPFGLVGLARTVRTFRLALRSGRWPAVPATILSAQIEKRKGTRGRHYWTPVIRYRYVADDRFFEGEQFDISGGWGSAFKSSAERKVSQYEPGRVVEVRVQPATPRSVCFGPVQMRAPI